MSSTSHGPIGADGALFDASQDNFYWQCYKSDAAAATSTPPLSSIRSLPQVVDHQFQLTIRECSGGGPGGGRSHYNIIEVYNVTPVVRSETQHPLLIYREVWNSPIPTDGSNLVSCAWCRKTSKTLKLCTGCKSVKYCDVDCQRFDRPAHKKECKRLAKGQGQVASASSASGGNDLLVEKIINALLVSMLEGGRLMAKHSPNVAADNLSRLSKDYFRPRRPGIIWIKSDAIVPSCLHDTKSRLENALNVLVLQQRIGGSASEMFTPELQKRWASLYTTPDNTVLEEKGGFQIHTLSKEEREEAFHRICRVDPFMGDMAKDDDCFGSLYIAPKDLTETKPKWERDGYESLKEAEEDYGDEYTKEELEKEIAGWEEQGYSSLEKACMENYNAKSVEEAIWDACAVERLRIIWPEVAANDMEQQNAIMKKAGWRYLGYKPKDIYPSEQGLLYGRRIVGGYGCGWGEGRGY